MYCRALAVIAGLGAIIELWLEEHTGSFVQWLPFVFCGALIVSVLLVSFRVTPGVLVAHRLVMLGVLIGAAYGIYAHLSHNMAFAREIRPNAGSSEIWTAGVRGANPLLASGILAMAAALGLMGAASRGTQSPTNP